MTGCVCTPVPLSPMEAKEFFASLTNETLPLKDPDTAGVKVTFIEVLCPGVNVTPLDTPVELNPDPETVTLVRVTVPVPVFETVNVCAEVAPTLTLPKLKLAGVNESCPNRTGEVVGTGVGLRVGGGVGV